AETAWLQEISEDICLPFACVGYADLRDDGLATVLDRHQQYSVFRGIRQEAWFDPKSTRADVPTENFLDDSRWLNGLKELARRNLSFDLLIWPSQLVQATELFAQVPALAVALDH